MYDLSNLKPAPGSTRSRKRKGRGPGAGSGKTAGRGTKGQKARSGGKVRVGFEGGQMPLIRRLPKRGFRNKFSKRVATVNVRDLDSRFAAGDVVDEAALRERGMVRGETDAIKVLGAGEIDKALTVRVDQISAGARAKIESAGGTVEVIGG